jgi:hypothetical protein
MMKEQEGERLEKGALLTEVGGPKEEKLEGRLQLHQRRKRVEKWRGQGLTWVKLTKKRIVTIVLG